jgi:hypothetical protein
MRALLSPAAQPHAGAARAGGGAGGAPQYQRQRVAATAFPSWRLVGGVGGSGGGGVTSRRDITATASRGGLVGRGGVGRITAGSTTARRGFAANDGDAKLKSQALSDASATTAAAAAAARSKRRMPAPALNARQVNDASGVGFGSGPLLSDGSGGGVLPVGADTIVLGIETSCDDTGAAVVTGDGRVLGEALASQVEIHAPWGGVVPNLAQEAHKVGREVVSTPTPGCRVGHVGPSRLSSIHSPLGVFDQYILSNVVVRSGVSIYPTLAQGGHRRRHRGGAGQSGRRGEGPQRGGRHGGPGAVHVPARRGGGGAEPVRAPQQGGAVQACVWNYRNVLLFSTEQVEYNLPIA